MAETNANDVGEISLVGRLIAISFEGYTEISIGIIVKHTSRFCTVEFADGFKSNYDLDVVGA